MDVRAIIVIGTHPEKLDSQQIAGRPYALVDVLGKSLAFRTIDRLQQHNIQTVAVVTDVPCELWPVGTATHGNWISAHDQQLWNSAEQVFRSFCREGAELVLVLALGGYAELDYDDLLQFHIQQRAPITTAVDSEGRPLGIYALNHDGEKEAAALFQRQLQAAEIAGEIYSFNGYVNHLSSPNHLRQLAIEGLMRRIQVGPEGEQIRPGVWLGRGAQVHKRARILSPAFIGAGARVRAAAVVTRCSALEHHTVVDCGTVVENTTTLPYTYVGAGLDVTHSIVGHGKLFNLKRGIEVEFSDPRLVGEASSHAPLRTLGGLLSLADFFPAQFLRGLFAKSHRECPASLPEAIAAPAAALETSLDTPAPTKAKATAPAVDAGEFPSQLVIARRYGNE